MKMVYFWLALFIAVAACKKRDPVPKAGSGASEESSAASADDNSPVELKVKWPVNNRYAERMEVNSDTETTLAQTPKPMLQKVQMNQEYSITVLRERELELEFESMEMDVTMNGKPVLNLDTRAEAGGGEVANPVAAGFRQIIGAKLKYILDASNRVEKVEGTKEFANRATAGSNPQGRAVMQSMFNEDYFKQMVDFGRGLPTQPVKAGDSWPLQTEVTVPALGAMKLDINYTLKGWEQRDKRKCAAIDFVGSMTSQGVTNTGPMGMSMKIEEGKLSGKTWFDPELGHPIETQISQDLLMQMSVPMPRAARTNTAGQTPASQNIINRTKNKVVIKLVEVVGGTR